MNALIYNHVEWITETNPSILFTNIDRLLRASGYTILNHIEHFFDPHGYTCLWLLAESHLALHTFPEHGKTYIELSGCKSEYNQRFMENLHNWLKITEK